MKDTQPQMLSNFIDAVSEAAGCAWQMAHIFNDPRWLSIRDCLEMVREIAPNAAIIEGINSYGR